MIIRKNYHKEKSKTKSQSIKISKNSEKEERLQIGYLTETMYSVNKHELNII